jgi:hypothetical protein
MKKGSLEIDKAICEVTDIAENEQGATLAVPWLLAGSHE